MKRIFFFLSVISFAAQAQSDSAAAFKTYSKFDFVPGEKIVGFEDFSTGEIGDFPAGWNTNAAGEIVSGYLLVKSTGAAAVKTALAKEFGIDESRMQIDGKGEGEPMDKNDTPAGKANNRRVEFIKI